LGNTLRTIKNAAFDGCTNLTSITIPASVETIENFAFCDCNNLTEVINLSAVPQDIYYRVFFGVDFNVCILRVPAASVDDYQQADGWMDFINILPLEAGMTGISLDKTEIYLLAGATTEITVTVTGSGIVEWNNSHPAVATVNNTGTVTAVSLGTTVINASAGTEKATCTVMVLQPGKSIIEGTENNSGTAIPRENLYRKPPEPVTKNRTMGGDVESLNF
jgi:hypothetical protein